MTLNSKQNQNYPNVSVIILTYNGGEYIQAAFRFFSESIIPAGTHGNTGRGQRLYR